jgi:hypothetical protein
MAPPEGLNYCKALQAIFANFRFISPLSEE